jgi:hypothetical protein
MITFETDPDRYKHWKLTFDGPIATISSSPTRSSASGSSIRTSAP